MESDYPVATKSILHPPGRNFFGRDGCFGESISPFCTAECLEYGVLLCKYESIGLAAKSMGSEKKQFANQIKRSKTGYLKGYNWKIID